MTTDGVQAVVRTENKHSGFVVLMANITAAILIFTYIYYGDAWYSNGNLRICTENDRISASKLPIPLNIDELSTPKYWCWTPPPKPLPPDPRCDDPVMYLFCGEEQLDQNDKYESLHHWWGNDIITNTISNIFDRLKRIINRTISEWFWSTFVPWWNEFFAYLAPQDNDPAKVQLAALAASRRVALHWSILAICTALVASVFKTTFDWAHERIIQLERHLENERENKLKQRKEMYMKLFESQHDKDEGP